MPCQYHNHTSHKPLQFQFDALYFSVAMAPNGSGTPTQATTDTQMMWSSKLTRNIFGVLAVKNHGKVDITLRVFLFIFSFIAIIVMATSKQTASIRVSPVMTISADAKFTHMPAFMYFVATSSVIWLYSIITGYSSYLALKKKERSSINQQLLFMLLDSLILSIAASATGAAGGIAYEARKGNTHVHWMKICDIFDTFCHHIISAEAISLLTAITLLMLVWFSICAIVKNRGM